MAESYVFIEQNYKDAFQNYLLIDDDEKCTYKEDEIVYGTLTFSQRGHWCLIEENPGDVYAEEILLKLSDGNYLVYAFTDLDQLDCEFIVIQSNKIIRKFFRYFDTEELNENVGKLPFEAKLPINEWSDIDEVIKLLFDSPDSLFILD